MEHVIEITGLVKDFGSVRALDGLDLEVHPSEVHGFLGPNGPGKSTTIRVLLGLLRADAGTAAAARRRPVARRGRAAPPARVRPGRREPVAQPLRRRGDRPARPAARRPRRAPSCASCSSGSSSTRPRRAGPTPRATGRRSRSSRPWPPTSSCCILDEPTSGLDPLMEAVFQRLHRRVPRRGAARSCCPATSWPRSRRCATGSASSATGRVVETGTLAELRHLTRTSIHAELAGTSGRTRVADAGVHDLGRRGHPGATSRSTRTDLGRRARAPRHVGIRTLTSQPPTLEELFLRHYGDTVAPAVTPGAVSTEGATGGAQVGAP